MSPATLPRIVQAGDPVLRSVARELRDDELGTSELRALVDTMIAVMRDAPGVGLAAPQIGVPLQVLVLEDDADRIATLPEAFVAERERIAWPVMTIVNPMLTIVGNETRTFFEGCLSVNGWAALVARGREVEVTGVDVEGRPLRVQAKGWPARILQHEVDHLRGTLYLDRMFSRSFVTADALASRWSKVTVAEAKRALGIVETD